MAVEMKGEEMSCLPLLSLLQCPLEGSFSVDSALAGFNLILFIFSL